MPQLLQIGNVVDVVLTNQQRFHAVTVATIPFAATLPQQGIFMVWEFTLPGGGLLHLSAGSIQAIIRT